MKQHDIDTRAHIVRGPQVAHMYARMDVVLGVYWEGGRMFAQPLINEMDWFNSAGGPLTSRRAYCMQTARSSAVRL